MLKYIAKRKLSDSYINSYIIEEWGKKGKYRQIILEKSHKVGSYTRACACSQSHHRIFFYIFH